MKAPKVTVLGGGSWGTAVASIAARNTDTMIWARDEATVEGINTQHFSERYLSGLPLHPKLRATADLEEAVTRADVIVLGVPSKACRAVLGEVAEYLRPWVPVVSLVKGLEAGSRLRMTQVVAEVLPGHPVGVLGGPNIAREVVQGYAAAATLAMPDQHLSEALQRLLSSRGFRVYTSTDVAGAELGGALKNVFAIATGIGDGLEAGDNTRSMVITRSLRELSRLGEAMGGQALTFSGLAGMGDLIVTCTSPFSRNRRTGMPGGESGLPGLAASAAGARVRGEFLVAVPQTPTDEERWSQAAAWSRSTHLNELETTMWRSERHPEQSSTIAALLILDRAPEAERLPPPPPFCRPGLRRGSTTTTSTWATTCDVS